MTARSRTIWLVMTVALGCAPTLAAQPNGPEPLSLGKLMATLSSVRHVEARYVEHRTLQALRTPLETRGTLRFEAPDQLEQAADPGSAGASERMTIRGNQLTIDHGAGRAPVTIMLNEHPDIALLADSLRALLSGDGETLGRNFDITPSGTLNRWQLVLQPRDPAQHTLMQWMRVTGNDSRITEIDTQQGNGDHSEMAIVEQTR